MSANPTVRLDPEVNAKLAKKSQETGRSVRELVAEALQFYFETPPADVVTAPTPVTDPDGPPEVSPGGVPLGSKRTEAKLKKDPLARAWDYNTRALRDDIRRRNAGQDTTQRAVQALAGQDGPEH